MSAGGQAHGPLVPHSGTCPVAAQEWRLHNQMDYGQWEGRGQWAWCRACGGLGHSGLEASSLLPLNSWMLLCVGAGCLTCYLGSGQTSVQIGSPARKIEVQLQKWKGRGAGWCMVANIRALTPTPPSLRFCYSPALHWILLFFPQS